MVPVAALHGYPASIYLEIQSSNNFINGSPSNEYSLPRGLNKEILLLHISLSYLGISSFIFQPVVDVGLFKGENTFDRRSVNSLVKIRSGGMRLYNMSIFKVPTGVLKVMESIRSRFFNGADQSEKKVTWVAWNKVLASKKHGGLGVSSFFALNRALLLKWVWRFVSQDGSLWYKVIRALYGSSVETHSTSLSSNWCSIMREVNKLKGKGFDFWSHCKKRIGNGDDSRFWFDCWIGDVPLRVKFPRLNARGGIEEHLLADLTSLMDSVTLSNSGDRWVCDLVSDGNFRVKEIRNYIDDLFLPHQAAQTRWIKYIPIKVNIFAWRARQDCLPTRVNLIRRGITIESSLCPGLFSLRGRCLPHLLPL
ncbi:RNA-directed DNA polymerase, eukaryota [Tanacetum coccineum]